jgi:hypothetical protein
MFQIRGFLNYTNEEFLELAAVVQAARNEVWAAAAISGTARAT